MGINPTVETDPCCGNAPFINGVPSPDGGSAAFIRTFDGQTHPRIYKVIEGVGGLFVPFRMSWYDRARQGDDGDTAQLRVGDTYFTPDAEWRLHSVEFIATTFNIGMEFWLVNPTGNDQAVAIDGVTITRIPEPTAAGLLMLTSLAFLTRCSRRRDIC
jgi:hypothetical protein